MKKDFSRLMVSIFYSFLGLSLLMLTSCGGGGGGSNEPGSTSQPDVIVGNTALPRCDNVNTSKEKINAAINAAIAETPSDSNVMKDPVAMGLLIALVESKLGCTISDVSNFGIVTSSIESTRVDTLLTLTPTPKPTPKYKPEAYIFDDSKDWCGYRYFNLTNPEVITSLNEKCSDHDTCYDNTCIDGCCYWSQSSSGCDSKLVTFCGEVLRDEHYLEGTLLQNIKSNLVCAWVLNHEGTSPGLLSAPCKLISIAYPPYCKTDGGSCDNGTGAISIDGRNDLSSEPQGHTFRVLGQGFQPGYPIQLYTKKTLPDKLLKKLALTADSTGRISLDLTTSCKDPVSTWEIWSLDYKGRSSNTVRQVILTSPNCSPTIPTADINGEWSGPYTLTYASGRSESYVITLSLTQSGTTVTGSWKSTAGSVGTFSGTVNGNTLNAKSIQTNPTCTGSFKMNGTVNGNTITITSGSGSTTCDGSEGATTNISGTIVKK